MSLYTDKVEPKVASLSPAADKDFSGHVLSSIAIMLIRFMIHAPNLSLVFNNLCNVADCKMMVYLEFSPHK